MTPQEKQVSKAFSSYWKAHFSRGKGAFEKVLSFWHPDITAIGTGKDEIVKSYSGFKKFLKREFEEVNTTLPVRILWTKVQLQKDQALVLGETEVTVSKGNNIKIRFRVSAVFKKQKNKWLLYHIHGSIPASAQRENESFPVDGLIAEKEKLEKEVAEKTADLLNKNRELEIESGLERVRARGMAMQTSEELRILIGTLFTELTRLDLVLTRCVIWIIDPETNDAVWWLANSEDPSNPMSYLIPYHKKPPYLAFLKEWEKRTVKWVYDLKGQTKKNWDDHLFAKTELSKMPKFIRDGMRAPDRVLLSASFSNFGGMNVASLEPLSNEHFDILLRFAKVFDLTYTRFNDLKKAEAQAKEAQIEAALERVRSRSMAMHKSGEIAAVASVLFHQLQQLDLPNLRRCLIGIVNKKTGRLQSWHTSLQGDSTHKVIDYPIDEHPVIKEKIKGWRKGKPFSIELSPEELKDFIKYIVTHGFEYQKGEKPATKLIQNHAPFKYGYLEVATHEPITDQDFELVQRFASVFEQTYTRFLDLQKAEAQAREAEIELALERVRARTMAMRKSDELLHAAILLFQQLRELGISTFASGFVLLDTRETEGEFWMSAEGEFQPVIYIPKAEEPILRNLFFQWEKGAVYHTEEAGGEKLKAHAQYLRSLPKSGHIFREMQKAGIEFPKWQQWNAAYFSHGYLLVITKEAFTEKNILERFAKVFEQTYTRFLDLQKAEAQAREAQIEAALERVRSRTMAMHKSDELKEVIQLVYEQFVHLNIHIEHTGFILDYKTRDDLHIWLADQREIPSEITIPCFDSPPNNSIKEAKEKGQDFFAYHLTFDEKNKFYRDLFKYIPGVPEESLEYYFNCPGLAGSGVLLENVGLYIENFSGTPYTDEENKTLMRFGKVFQQTYTRFLDLQKAEAQAREAQIEAALERVRARTMGMQRSDELQDAAMLLFQQIEALGVPVFGCGFNIWDDDRKAATAWMAGKDRLQLPFKTSSSEDIFLRIYETAQTGETLFVEEQAGKALKTHYEYMNTIPVFKEISDKMAKAWQGFPTFQIMHCAFFSHGYLMFISFEPVPSAYDIFKRFAKVFEQTYIRFLDLQKAEAQAREAQIEAALERIRARSIAMHKSNELKDVVRALYKEFRILVTDIDSVNIQLNLDSSKDIHFWASVEEDIYPELYHLQYSDLPIFEKFYNAFNSSGESFFDYLLNKEEKDAFFSEVFKIQPVPPKRKKMIRNAEGMVMMGWVHKHSGIDILRYNLKPFSKEEKEIVKRFAAAFEQTYTRFLDLQKSEAQTRESEIQLALERVRARTMAMHKSEELSETVAVLFQQFNELGSTPERMNIGLINEGFGVLEVWSTEQGGRKINHSFNASLKEPTTVAKTYAGWKEGKKSMIVDLSGSELDDWIRYLQQEMKMPFKEELRHKRRVHSMAFFSSGVLLISTPEPVPQETINLLKRFADVFNLTYRRFLDLQKAEAQAREAQIEASLERVRARTSAMHKSDELVETSDVLFKEIEKLGIKAIRTGVALIDGKKNAVEVWSRSEMNNQLENRILGVVPASAHPMYAGIIKAWKEKKSYYAYNLEGDNLVNYYKELSSYLSYPKRKKFNKRETIATYFFHEGSLNVISYEPLNIDQNNIMIRFAKVFGQLYRRFLDLQKAEAQAKESEIQLALERVRARTMAMHKSDELAATAKVLFEQFDHLGKIPDRIGIGTINEKTKEVEFWLTDQTGNELTHDFSFSIDEPTSMAKFYKAWKEGKDSLVVDLTGKSLKDWLQYVTKEGRLPVNFENIKGRRVHHVAFFSRGFLVLTANERITDEMLQLLVRFAGVFDQTYRRFLDLQKAEAQAREALKQASLDRVRGEIASMRTSEDLNRITPVIWRELKTMEVPFIRCGVFIVSDDQTHTRVYLTTPEGKSLGVLNLSTESNALTKNSVEHWRNKQIYKEHWNKEEFINWTKSMMKLGQIQNPETYQGSSKPPESLYLHFVPFAQGMLYVGNVAPLDEEKLELVKTLAEAFSIAYARYEDFKNLEEAKTAVEGTLKELKSAQAQLVHSEKMASLGELTAGIAHEIKNPLNFVNNFSEVSAELIDEAMEELQKGNNEDVLDIVKDLKQNLEKINQHGKRADSIVKGMLLHSRGTAGEKAPTDINDLLEQYVTLAYHGMRAQNKDFNITIERDYDKSLEKIKVVPQDISRVFLNIINNGCYSANDKKKKDGDGFSPTIKVSTKNLKDKVEIRISDNGNGIPDKIKDKLFQPFFTTKPTGEGTGLGLSLSYDIVVKQHGGEIKIDSKEGEGAEFVITLPYS